MWLSEDNVMESDFLLQWKEFICSKEVKNMCAESGVTFVFLPHPEFKSFKNYPFINEEHVLVADLNDKNIQSYLIDADLLITDYSSVYFDFAFMNKPVIYYQFDETDYYSKHYLKGYFDYDTMGFGPKFTKPSEVITYLQKLLKKSINLDVYAKRCDKFFLLKDNNNPSPEEEFMILEEHKELKEKIKDILTDKEKEVFDLRFEGFTYQEIAILLNMSKKAVDGTIFRIKQKIMNSKEQ